MNVPSPAAPSALRRSLSRRLILRTRLACGGAVAGLFAGSILVAILGALLDSGPFGILGIYDVIVYPIALAIAGAAWGILLGGEEPAPDNPALADSHSSPIQVVD